MLLLASTSVWILSTFEKITNIMSITSRDRMHFVQDVFLHTQSTYTIYTIWKPIIQGKNWQVSRCSFYAFARYYKCLKLKYLKKFCILVAWPNSFFFKKFISAHTLNAHTLYIPFESLWSKEENDGCQIFIRCFFLILKIFEA